MHIFTKTKKNFLCIFFLQIIFLGCGTQEPSLSPSFENASADADTDTDSDTDTDTDTDSDTDTDTDTDADTDTDTDTDTDSSGDVDCENVPAVPIEFETLSGFTDSEDFAFDGEGNMVANKSNNLLKVDIDGKSTVLLANIGETNGMCFLLNGDLAVADYDNVYRVAPNGSKSTVISNLAYANGMEVDLDGYIYVSEQEAGRVRRINPDNGEYTIIAKNLPAPNGLSFGPEMKTLYIGNFYTNDLDPSNPPSNYEGKVYMVTRNNQGEWATPELFATIPNEGGNGGGLDGLAVDNCGYVWIAEYITGILWRISPDGKTVEEAAKLPSGWIPNMHWGEGIGGWNKKILYVLDRDMGRVFAVKSGVFGKPVAFP